MGKYMKKRGRVVGEIAVMEFPAGGVRTRARTLAALRRRRSCSAGELQICYLELRSRKLVKIMSSEKERQRELRTEEVVPEEVNSVEVTEEVRVSRCSSNSSIRFEEVEGGEEMIRKEWIRDSSDLEAEVSLGENGVDSGCTERMRETTPSSRLESEFEVLESTTSLAGNNSAADRRKKPCRNGRISLPEKEIEEFFASFEKEEVRRFTEKYNYDAERDIPLSGRYEWVKLTP